MKGKYLYIDVETTGLNAWQNGISQLSGIIEIDDEIKEKFNFFVKPFPDDLIEDEALKITGFTREQLKTFEDPIEVWKKLKTIFGKYVNPFKKGGEKFISVGYNFQFDKDRMTTYSQKVQEIDDPETLNKMYDLFDNIQGPDLTNQNIEWLKAFFTKNGDVYFNSWCRNIIDTRQLYTLYAIKAGIDIHKSTRLADVCEKFNIEIKAHDAMSDIEATQKLFKLLIDKFTLTS